MAEQNAKGSTTISAMDYIVTHLAEVILQFYDRILNRQFTADLVDIMRRRYPAVVDGVMPQHVSLAHLQKVLAGLVTARVPVNRLDYIIEYLEEHPIDEQRETEKAIAALTKELC